jgi:hypothetical protein
MKKKNKKLTKKTFEKYFPKSGGSLFEIVKTSVKI